MSFARRKWYKNTVACNSHGAKFRSTETAKQENTCLTKLRKLRKPCVNSRKPNRMEPVFVRLPRHTRPRERKRDGAWLIDYESHISVCTIANSSRFMLNVNYVRAADHCLSSIDSGSHHIFICPCCCINKTDDDAALRSLFCNGFAWNWVGFWLTLCWPALSEMPRGGFDEMIIGMHGSSREGFNVRVSAFWKLEMDFCCLLWNQVREFGWRYLALKSSWNNRRDA